MNGKRFFSAASESQAVIEAAAELGVPPAELAYVVRQGALRQGRVVIVVDTQAPRRPPTPPPAEAPRGERLARDRPGEGHGAPGPRAGRPPGAREPQSREAGPEAPAEPHPATGADGARRAAQAVIALVGLDLTSDVGVSDGGLRVELSGPGRESLVAQGGELLRTAEYLLRRMVRDLPEDGLTLDSEGFRAEREGALRRRAAAAAEEVRSSGEATLLEPLGAAERRIVHLAIADEPGVASESEGTGESKRVRIRPAT